MYKIKMLGFFVVLMFSLVGCSSNNQEYVKERAQKIWKQQGFEIVAYEGFNWGIWGCFGSEHGGANVWYRLKKTPDNGLTYSGYLKRWGDEIHVYGPKIIEGGSLIQQTVADTTK